MLTELLKPYKTIAIIGMAKNSGKTTVLNHIIGKHPDTLGITSIGRDGEVKDVVTNTEKPRIFVRTGTIIATAAQFFESADILKETLFVTDINTPLGQVVIFRACSDGFVEIAGASIVSQMGYLVECMRNFNAKKIIIDGAVGRKSLANPQIAEAVILCTGAAISQNMQTVVAETAFAVKMLMLPKIDDESYVYLPKLVTDQLLAEYVKVPPKGIIIDDATKLFISPQMYKKMQIKGIKLGVKTPINLIAVTINPTSPYGLGFESQKLLSGVQAVVDLPVYDVVKYPSVC
ncbi:MAG: hypothetical protein FWG65_12700 [Turicibacter sp.]|nr:hypothetical protein [Turicibacter sp.]